MVKIDWSKVPKEIGIDKVTHVAMDGFGHKKWNAYVCEPVYDEDDGEWLFGLGNEKKVCKGIAFDDDGEWLFGLGNEKMVCKGIAFDDDVHWSNGAEPKDTLVEVPQEKAIQTSDITERELWCKMYVECFKNAIIASRLMNDEIVTGIGPDKFAQVSDEAVAEYRKRYGAKEE